MANRTKSKRNRKPHITPKQSPAKVRAVKLSPTMQTVNYIEEIWLYYDKHNTVPDLLPLPYKQFLLAKGMAEYLTNTEKPYVVFSEKGSTMYQAWWKEKYRRKGKAA